MGAEIYKKRIIDFVVQSGWKEDTEPDSDFRSFNRDNNISIDISDEEIVLVGGDGDFKHIMIEDDHTIYMLVGYLHYHGFIAK